MKKRRRLDELVCEKGLCPDLEAARRLILAGQICVDDQRIDKVGALVALGSEIRLKAQKKYVSRGGDKLSGVVSSENLGASFLDAIVLDIGSSTGGFTDFALQAGAQKVIAVDVGENQLDYSLRQDPRVRCHEKTDIRQFEHTESYDVVMADISFNSLNRLIETLKQVPIKDGGVILFLIKPQFEMDPKEIPKGGVVDDHVGQEVAERTSAFLTSHGFGVGKLVPSPLRGQAGNQEYFFVGLSG